MEKQTTRLSDSRSLQRPAWTSTPADWYAFRHKHRTETRRPNQPDRLLNYFVNSKGME
jgi:hypothetical protein